MKSQVLNALRQLPVEELKAQLKECEDKYFHLIFKNKVAPAKNRLEIRTLRRHRARLNTWIRANSQKDNI